MRTVKIILILALLAGSGSAAFIYSGFYPMAADVPHTKFVYWLLETMRERSIERAAADIVVPDLDNPELLLAGGPDYHEMCATCHLRPGRSESDMSLGLYPSPPNLATHSGSESHDHDDEATAARRQFWIIKHGIKASGMPAWGSGHDDQRIWSMVSFLQALPELTQVQYQILTARGEDEADHH